MRMRLSKSRRWLSSGLGVRSHFSELVDTYIEAVEAYRKLQTGNGR